MRKTLATIFNFIAKSIATLFAALFVITTILVLLLLNFEHTLFNAETYKRALIENKVYQGVPALVAEEVTVMKDFIANRCINNPLGCAIEGASSELQACLTKALGGEKAYEEIGSGQRKPTEAELQLSQPCLDQYKQAGEISPPDNGGVGGPQMTFMNNLSPEQWQAVINHLLPADNLQRMTETTLDHLFAYLNGETDSVKLLLTPLKARLSGQAGQDFILLMLNSQPPCTAEQLARINAGDFGGKGQPTLLCATSGKPLDKLLPELQRQLNQALSGIPDEASLIEPPSASAPSQNSSPFDKNPQAALVMLRQGLRLSPLLPLSLLLLVTLFGVRSLKGWLRWWGIPLLIVGLIVLSFGISAQPVFDWAWSHYVLAKIPPTFSAGMAGLAHDLARFVARDLAMWITLEAGFIALLGLGAIFASVKLIKQAAPGGDSPPAAPPGQGKESG